MIDGLGYAVYSVIDEQGSMIIFDPWTRGKDRTNSNFIFLGISGTGKSTAMKHIIFKEFMMGTKIIIVDPEKEFWDVTAGLGGDIINCGGGNLGRINPLQIRPAPRDEEEDEIKLYRDEGYGLSDMALHIKTLDIFFGLYVPSLTDIQKAILKMCVIELYNRFGIQWETDVTKLKSEEFPSFLDLHQLIGEKAKAAPEEPAYKELALLLRDIALGSDSFLWNGKTTLESNARCVCLDTLSLQDAGANIKRTQYFNILTWAWERMSRDRDERVMLVCDEAYLMADPQVPQSLVFLRNVSRRARKYMGSLVIISHLVADFISPEVKMHGQAILDMPTYKFFFGTDGKNFQEVVDLFNLTEAEEEFLSKKEQREALFFAGAKRQRVKFALPQYELDMMGKGGGL